MVASVSCLLPSPSARARARIRSQTRVQLCQPPFTGAVRLSFACRSPGGDLGAKRKKKKQKRKKEKPSSGGAKSDSASDSQEIKVRR